MPRAVVMCAQPWGGWGDMESKEGTESLAGEVGITTVGRRLHCRRFHVSTDALGSARAKTRRRELFVAEPYCFWSSCDLWGCPVGWASPAPPSQSCANDLIEDCSISSPEFDLGSQDGGSIPTLILATKPLRTSPPVILPAGGNSLRRRKNSG